MSLQVFATPQLYGRVEVEIRQVDACGNMVRGVESILNLRVLNSVSLLPVEFRESGVEGFSESVSVCVGENGYVKSKLVLNMQDKDCDEVLLRASMIQEKNEIFESKAIKLLKYRLEVREVRLTDDISNYDGEDGIYYTNNDSARVKVLYSVYDADGLLTDTTELTKFHSEIHSQLLFANGDRVQYVDESGNLVDIIEIDCLVKRKYKEEDKSRILKKVFEEKKNELNIISNEGLVKVCYRLNMFSSHPKLKSNNLDGRKYTIELSHANSTSVSIPPVRILTKYHRPKKSGISNTEIKLEKEYKDIKKEPAIKVEPTCIKEEKEEPRVKLENQKAKVEEVNIDKLKSMETALASQFETSCHHTHIDPNSHFFPYPSNLNTPPSHPSFHFPFVHSHHSPHGNQKQTPAIVYKDCIETARYFVDSCLEFPARKAPPRKTASKKLAKAFKKATSVKKDSTFQLKKPTIIKMKKPRMESTVESYNIEVPPFFSNEELTILQSFLFPDSLLHSGGWCVDGLFPDATPECGSAMLSVPDISDEDLEPYLLSEEQFVDFNLFA